MPCIQAGRVVGEEGDGQTFALEGGEDLARAVGAVVVKDEVMIHPGQGVPDEGLDDIGFVFDDGDSDEAHGGSVLIPG